MLQTSADPQLHGLSPDVEAAYRDVRALLDPAAAVARVLAEADHD